MVELDADTRRALVEQAYQVEQLTKQPGWAILADYWLTRTRQEKEKVLDGRVVDFAAYKSVTGYFSGVHDVLRTTEFLNTLADNARRRAATEHEDDDEAA